MLMPLQSSPGPRSPAVLLQAASRPGQRQARNQHQPERRPPPPPHGS
jgi:hypothetical protein